MARTSGVNKRPDGKWRARYRDETGKEITKHFARWVDADKWRKARVAEVESGTHVDPNKGKVTFEKWFARYEEEQIDWTEGTRLAAKQAAAGVPFANVAMSKVTTTHVTAWLRAMKHPTDGRRALAASTIHTRYNYVRMSFSAAVRAKVIGSDPFDGLEKKARPRRPKKKITTDAIPTPDQVRQALDAAPDWFSGFLAVCAFAGLRLGEAAGLRVEDVDFLRKTIVVRRQIQGKNATESTVTLPKGQKEDDDPRVIQAPQELLDLLSKHIQDHGTRGEERYFFADVFGNLLNRTSAGHQWRRTRSQVGMERFTIHDFRHFYASALIAGGCDVVTVQHSLGHSSATITLDTYSHFWMLNSDRTRDVAGALMRSVLAGADQGRTSAPKTVSDLRL